MKHLIHKKRRVSLSLFLAILVSIALPCVALADATIELTLPTGVTRSDVGVTLYKGALPSSSILEVTEGRTLGLDTLKVIPESGDLSYNIVSADTYCYYVSGDNYYSILKLINVSQDHIDNNAVITQEIMAHEIGGDGYEPCNPNLDGAPSNYVSQLLDARDKIIGVWPDEILAHFTSNDLVGYDDSIMTTPWFTKSHAQHQFTSQEEMMEFLDDLEASNPNKVYLFSLGETANRSYDVPIVIVTKTPIPANATFDEAAAIIRSDDKLNVWHQGQIHPNEPAAGEGALVMLQEMAGTYGEQFLDTINFISIPRLNPDGSYLFTRVTYGGYDMNRDHMRLQAIELAYAHTAFSKIMPEVVMDGHEFTYNGLVTSTDRTTALLPYRMNHADDIESTPASSLNNSAKVNAFAMDVVSTKIHADLKAANLRNYHYGDTVNNPIGRAYYGLFNSISILIETRGIGAGSQNFPRRVFSQVTAVKSITETAVASADKIREMVAEAREEIITKGATYDESDKLVLYHTATGNTKTPFTATRVRYNMDGSVYSATPAALDMKDKAERTRTRPTAYIIPKDANAENLNIERALYITTNQGGRYYEIAPGAIVSVDQYYYVGPYNNPSGNTVGFEAGTRGESAVKFEQGAYVIPMDQVAGNVLGMLWEPDVNDSNGYNGTLVQSQLISRDAEMNYPYYRYTYDDPRNIILLEEPSEPAGPTVTETPSVVGTPAGTQIVKPADVVVSADTIKDSVSGSTEVTTLLNSYATVTAEGVLQTNPAAVKTFLNDKGEAETGVKSDTVAALPVISFPVTSKNIGIFSFSVSLNEFAGVSFSDLMVVKLLADDKLVSLTDATSLAAMKDGEYAIFSGNTRVSATDKVIANRVYTVTIAIEDDGALDLDATPGNIIDPAFIAQKAADGYYGGSGSSGCDAGFGVFALIAAAGVAILRKKD